MTDRSAASPRPWRVGESDPWCVYAADGRLVADFGPRPDPHPTWAERDAAWMVDAANREYDAQETGRG